VDFKNPCEKCQRRIVIAGAGPHHVVCPTCGTDNGVWEFITDTSDLPDGAPAVLSHFQNLGIDLPKGVWCKRSSSSSSQPVPAQNDQADRSVETSIQQPKSSSGQYPAYPEFPSIPSLRDEGSEGNDQLVSFIEFKPSDFTRVGWMLFLISYMAMVLILCCIIGMVGKQVAGRIGFKLFWLVFTVLPFGFGISFFYAGKWVLENKLNIRVIKKTPSEAANWHSPDVAHNVVIALTVLVPLAVYLYIALVME
jgi:hypothetical protein